MIVHWALSGKMANTIQNCLILIMIIQLVFAQDNITQVGVSPVQFTMTEAGTRASQPITTESMRVTTQQCPTPCSCDSVTRIVDCSFTGLTAIPIDIPEYTTSLIMDYNTLSQLTADSFTSVPNLYKLSLKSCSIEEISDEAFRGLTNLHTLEIQQNSISSLENILNGLGKLAVLKVSQNKIKILDHYMFRDLKDLTVFEAHNNDISTISAGAFQSSPNLAQLYLPNCKLENLTQYTFQNLINLNYLDVSGNTNRHLGPNIFTNMLQLEYLYLSNMGIETIDKDTFSQLTNLKVLSLSDNNLRTVSKNTFDHLTGLTYLLLRNNLWNCTCPLLEFRKWNLLKEISFDHPWACHDPEFLRNAIVLNVDEKQFGCEPWIYNLGIENNNEDSVDIGKSAVLICEAVGEPEASITWSTPDGNVINATSNTERIYISNNRLIINAVVTQDSGKYRCTAKNSRGSHLKEFTLVVTGIITDPPTPQCPLATLSVETVRVTDTNVKMSWTPSVISDASGYVIQTTMFGEVDSITTERIDGREKQQWTVQSLIANTDYIVCVSVDLSGACPSITPYDQCKQVHTTGDSIADTEQTALEKKHQNELIGTATVTFLGTLLILASIFVIIWRYKKPREFTKYDFKLTNDTSQFADMMDMPDTSSAVEDINFQGNATKLTLVATFNNPGYINDAHDEQTVNTDTVDAGENENTRGKKTNGLRVKNSSDLEIIDDKNYSDNEFKHVNENGCV